MLWEKKISFLNLFGFREYSKYRERLTTIKEYKESFLKGSILDVGCGKNFNELKLFFGKRYFGLDLPFLKKNKDKNFINHNINLKRLPFKNNTFKNIICTDVLEHVDNPHLLIKELFRVSSGKVIISLPNNWPTFYWDIILGTELKKKIGYGLFEKSQPEGLRHKFFFNFEHACNFLETNCPKFFFVDDIRFIFEHNNDGIVSSLPILNKIYNILGKIEYSIIKSRMPFFLRNNIIIYIILFLLKFLLIILKLPNIIVTALLYGVGIKRFYNLFCRQVWFFYVIKK